MSAVAKLLRSEGVSVSGSDAAATPLTEELKNFSIPVTIGHEPAQLPEKIDLVIYSSAVPEQNPERREANRRDIPSQTNFSFLGEWSRDKESLLVTGTHGKSTTTAMLGLMLIKGQLDPTVIVGSKVPSFPEGNFRAGKSKWFLVEGDEYARHFLEFSPSAVIVNNIELDHTDIFPDLSAMIEAFRALLRRVRDGGLVIANADDPQVQTLIGQERSLLEERRIRVRTFGFGAHADYSIMDYTARPGEQAFVLRDEQGVLHRLSLRVPGKMNAMNAVAAATLALLIGVRPEIVRSVLAAYGGIWRRFELIAERNGTRVVSDYGHHPTAVRANLEACKTFYPGQRILLCYQPHQRKRTRSLFLDFIPAFDRADALILAEIWDVQGREEPEDQDISSRDLQEAILHHDADRLINRPVEYVPTPEEALQVIKRWQKPGDLILIMGAGDIYKIASRVFE